MSFLPAFTADSDRIGTLHREGVICGTVPRETLDPKDARDVEIVRAALAERWCDTRPLVGDVVHFLWDDTYRRISHLTDDRFQTSSEGSWHLLCDGDMSFSGGLHGSTARASLLRTDRGALGAAWVFHHDRAGAGRGRIFAAEVKVWECEEYAPR